MRVYTYNTKYINLRVRVCVCCVCGFVFSFWTYKNTAVKMLSIEDTLKMVVITTLSFTEISCPRQSERRERAMY